MNERFKELAEQAGYKPLPGFDFANSLEEVFIKKFAELIVRECMAQCADNGSNDEWDKGEDWVCADGTRIIPQIQEHFGVE